ncbi:hypothetical protein B14911_14842 [Bacillus sp. NRRL B-14911]|uniref:Uncharacterized protein n=1 Tax=Bacillus infantis NRRL B-14911 TaxID=1367477 RepID=U5L6Y1_9BACI|nr:hypothetical protein N288_06160 [Bacillus infantis NRRL B-14911]EAR66654.1 hypothetical protein B14911_14842 [Bacillus sp. NRRL B-14911]
MDSLPGQHVRKAEEGSAPAPFFLYIYLPLVKK